MNLIVGLGNPGSEYASTRHNLGFAVIDLLAQSWGANLKVDSKLQGFVCKDIAHDSILLMPTTYMNNSGQAVKSTIEYYKINASKLTPPNLSLVGEGPDKSTAQKSSLVARYSPLIVIHDDLDIPLGKLKIQPGGGGSGGHNGVKSIIQHFGSPDFIRFRLGIGRPPHPQIDPADWVLQKPTGAELQSLNSLVTTTAHAIESLLQSGLQPTMNQYNTSAS